MKRLKKSIVYEVFLILFAFIVALGAVLLGYQNIVSRPELVELLHDPKTKYLVGIYAFMGGSCGIFAVIWGMVFPVACEHVVMLWRWRKKRTMNAGQAIAE